MLKNSSSKLEDSLLSETIAPKRGGNLYYLILVSFPLGA